ncbi:MAG: hypothetical protein ACFE91_08555 [Promethearchaeota archaeon]
MLPYPGSDPYHWFKNIWIVHKNGAIDYDESFGYPPGFILFCASMLSVIDDYYTVYFFLKYISIFLSIINILVLFEISNKLFKKKIFVFLTLSMYLSMNYLFFRYTVPIPSILATTLGFLFLLSLREYSISQKILTDIKSQEGSYTPNYKKMIIIRGIILAGIINIHPLYGLLYILFYLTYEVYRFIIILKFNKGLYQIKKIFILKFSKFLLLIFLIISLFTLPWYLGTSINLDYPLYRSILYYISPISLFNPLFGIRKIGIFFYKLAEIFLSNSIYFGIDTFFVNFFLKMFNFQRSIDFYFQTIGTGIILIVIGIFLPFNKYFKFNEKQKNIVRFVRFTFIFSILLCLFATLFNFRHIEALSKLNEFLSIYLRRLFELFAGYWVLLFALSFNYIVLFFPRLIFKSRYNKKNPINENNNFLLRHLGKKNKLKYLKFKSKIFKLKVINQFFNLILIQRILNKFRFKVKFSKKKTIHKIFNISIIILAILTCGFYYIINYKRIYYYNHFSDEYTETVLFAGNYFNENPLNNEKVILLQRFESKRFIYDLLAFDNLKLLYYVFNYNSTNFLNYTDYIEFKNFVNTMNVTYVLFNIVFTDGGFQTNFYTDFIILYQNAAYWIFAQLK